MEQGEQTPRDAVRVVPQVWAWERLPMIPTVSTDNGKSRTSPIPQAGGSAGAKAPPRRPTTRSQIFTEFLGRLGAAWLCLAGASSYAEGMLPDKASALGIRTVAHRDFTLLERQSSEKDTKISVGLTPAWKAQYEAQWAAMKVPAAKMAEALAVARKIVDNQQRYVEVEKATGVPWYWVASVHWREASGRFDRYLGDGEPLDHPTHNVPKGRGPFRDFLSGCVDALTHEGLNREIDWSIGAQLFNFERYNGEGYRAMGSPSPYVFAGSSIYKHGKYNIDGHFVSSMIDTQLGCAVILQALVQIGAVSFGETGAKNLVADTNARAAPFKHTA
jgi:lysozyme family protein